MAVVTQNFADLLAVTLGDLGPLRFQQVYQDLQHYEVLSKWMKKDKVQFASGTSVKKNIMIRDGVGSSEHVGLLDEDTVNIQDVMRTLSVEWVHLQTKWAMVYQTDVLMNSGRSLIVDVIKPRRAKAIIDMAQELEDKAWGSAPGTSNTTLPNGIQYWVVRNSTTGFTGSNPGSHTATGGIDADTDTRWKNYSHQYTTEITKTGAVKQLRTAKRKTAFVSPVTVKDYRGAVGSRYRLYCNETTISEFEDIGEGQNESLGKDVASMDGQIVFRGNPIIYIPKLDSDSGNPVYMLDHSTFYPICLKGDYLREGNAERAPNQHNVFQVFVDMSYNYLCTDRRRNSVIYK